MHARRWCPPAILRAMTETYVRSIEAQIIGRVFTHDGSIHFVLDTDPQTGLARCSRRTEDGPGVCHVPMTTIRQILIDQGGVRHDEQEAEPADDEEA
ncbi:MAG TPA: hypothetical protein VIS76_16960 [Pseudomonadales bacterium]